MKAVRNIVAILVLVAAGCNRETYREGQSREECENNLLLLQRAKGEWAKALNKGTNDVPVITELTNYMKDVLVDLKRVTVCPSGGTYMIGPVGKNPACSIKGHVLSPDYAP